ncbi:Heparinase II/III family protein [Niastella koreensis GR20-10]|uniref:Heparinase II/III family protein n=3 Tax=Niastella koreensis TaxID=354356 RepID=G8TCF3_NIAKG|nr:Heparinase II/III family protein [Niastella koreensis GR20-10]
MRMPGMKRIGIISMLIAGLFNSTMAQQHPSILLTRQKIDEVRNGVSRFPLLQQSWKEVKKDADKALKSPIDVPVPHDAGGGTTHEQHKKNYQNVLACGIAWQITKDEQYARFVKDILFQYAAVYNTWPRHPKRKDTPGGKMFWQSLNDCVWQVYVIQGYDCIYDYLKPEERKKIEDNLFEPIVKEFSEVNGEIFNKIHNHGTWSVAAVGMTGYVCGRKDWVDIALHGSKKDDKTGFLAQLNELFSPDGYYTEGPYYQRYAILPFILFAKTIQQYQPELKIYDYRNGLLKKSVNTALQCTYTNKMFFPVNDAMKDKSYETEEMIYAVDIAYSDMQSGDDLLDVAQQQQKVIVSDAGLKVAKAVAEGKTKPFAYVPMWISDGADGKGGGLGILRSGSNDDQACVLMKAASQGMGHGHFDRLNILYYDNNTEVFSDYGAVRFLNIESKNGGNYTKENNTWGKQTVAHNTIAVDKQSQYQANEKAGDQHAPGLIYFNNTPQYQVVSAEEDHAFEGVQLVRTAILFKPEGAQMPLLIDVFKAKSKAPHQYDLPFWYQGQLTDSNFPVNANKTKLLPAGDNYGYQHMWVNSDDKVNAANGVITILNNKRFYTTTFLADTGTSLCFVTCGANDPEFNLRNEKGFIISQKAAAGHTFINITEPHGQTNPIAEYTKGFKPLTKDIKLVNDNSETTGFEFTYNKKTYTVTLQYNNKQSFITIK